MATIEGTSGVVRIPTTAREWQLYDMRGAEAAALRLAEAAEAAVRAPTRSDAIGLMRAALAREIAFGARDTEPRQLAEELLGRGRGGDFAWSL